MIEASCSQGGLSEGKIPVFKVKAPPGWKPAAIDDIPPNVERLEFPSPAAAASFLRMFNERSLQTAGEYWAVG